MKSSDVLLGNKRMETFSFRKACPEDFNEVWAIIQQAKQMMGESGRTQWNDNYPTKSIILADLDSGCAFVLCHALSIVAYGVVVRNGEPEYEHLSKGAWQCDGDYYVVHRLAVGESFRGKGIAQLFLNFTFNLSRIEKIKSIRIDTSCDNLPMISVLKKSGFIHCGRVCYPVNGEREVYEKIVD